MSQERRQRWSEGSGTRRWRLRTKKHGLFQSVFVGAEVYVSACVGVGHVRVCACGGCQRNTNISFLSLRLSKKRDVAGDSAAGAASVTNITTTSPAANSDNFH